MKLVFNNSICEVLFFVLLVTTCVAASDDGFLNVTCNDASDCYVLDDVSQGLWLACWYNVHKCKCQNTFYSDFNLKWENNQCLMSKYGPCGSKGELAVGCQDGFICVNNECRDPRDTRAVKTTPFLFSDSKCSQNGCQFSDDLALSCNGGSNQCECKKVFIADGRSTYWDIRNYDGNNDCSVGKFGPCGIKNGIKIDCHGDGISCVDGTCVNANHPVSEVDEDCASVENCKQGLLCSQDYKCIEPFSLAEGQICNQDNECQQGLRCQRRDGAGPWSLPICRK